jgi:hypothetical protein
MEVFVRCFVEAFAQYLRQRLPGEEAGDLRVADEIDRITIVARCFVELSARQ